jgi:hypothetical protein
MAASRAGQTGASVREHVVGNTNDFDNNDFINNGHSTTLVCPNEPSIDHDVLERRAADRRGRSDPRLVRRTSLNERGRDQWPV